MHHKSLVKPANGIFVDHLEINLVATEVPDVVEPVLDHARPAKDEENSFKNYKYRTLM